MTDELIGSALLHHLVVRKIGEGGMGAVYLAHEGFTEARSESYRALGQHMVDALVAQPDDGRVRLTIKELFDLASGRASAAKPAVSV